MSTDLITPPAHASADWTIPQDWAAYTPGEHAMWDRLFARQAAMLPSRVVPAFIDGLDVLRMTRPGIPDFDELNARLMKDIFHDVFGHVPLLVHPVFADYMQAYGEGGLRAAKMGMIDALARLYWYTVEFGLIRDDGALKLYGAGIVSSYGESHFALDDPSPHRIGFDLERIMHTDYRIDDYQQNYFVIDSFEDLLHQTRDADFGPLYDRLRAAPLIPVAEILPTDKVLHAGTQAYARAKVPA